MTGLLPSDDQVLDWNARWKVAAAMRWQRTEKHSQYWNKRAPSFGERNLDSS